MDPKKLVAAVTGGASGLGEAVVRQFASRGAKTAILDFDETRGQSIAAELEGMAVYCRTDVADEHSVTAAMERIMAAFGKIDVVVNCAGIAPPAKVLGKNGPMAIADFNRVVQVNLIGTLNVIRLAAAKMVDNTPNGDGERGVIVNTASIAAFEGQVGQAAYSASKAGVVGLTLPLAREFAGHGIRVMTIAPGLFMTPMMAGLPDKVQRSLAAAVPFPKRLGKPEEFAMLAMQIIENPALNGETIRLDSALRMGA